MPIAELLTPRGRPAVLHYRDDTSDLAVLGSHFAGVVGSPLVDEYGLADLHLSGRFVDVGAHIGAVTVAILLDNPDATAICIEPIPENAELVRANLAANGLDGRAQVLQGAVGTNAITYDFSSDRTNRYIGNLTVSPKRQPAKRIRVRMVTPSEFLPAEAVKFDCEGGEWAVIADPALLRVRTVFGEFHGQPGQPGILAAFGKTHKVTFDRIGGAAGNFRAVAR